MKDDISFVKDIVIDGYLLIKNFNISITKGRNTMFLGTTGSGKTTVLKKMKNYFKNNKDILVCVYSKSFKNVKAYSGNDKKIMRFLKEESYIKHYLVDVILKKPKYLFLDDLSSFLSNADISLFFKLLDDYGITYGYFTTSSDLMFLFSYLYVISLNCIAMEGSPMSFFKEEKVFNKLGFSFPFYPSLSKKLMMYDILSDICFDCKELEGALWK